MIKVTVLHVGEDGEQLLAEIQISNEGSSGMRSGMTAYHAEIGVDDGESARLMTVMIEHPREAGNVLALVREVLNTLSSDQLEMKGPIGDRASAGPTERGLLRFSGLRGLPKSFGL